MGRWRSYEPHRGCEDRPTDLAWRPGREQNGRVYPEIGIADGQHGLTHHSGDPVKIARVVKINTHQIGLLAKFMDKPKNTPDGNGTLLDNSLVFGFSDTGYAKIHSIENIPMFLAGGAGGKHKAGQHVASKGESVTRVSLTAMQIAGAPVGEFGAGTMKTSRPISEVMA